MTAVDQRRKGIARNGFWHTAQQAVVMGGNAVTAVLLIRTLDMADYGVYAYATALSAFGIAVMTAGLSGLAVRELVANRDDNAALVSAFVLVREFFALIAFVGLIGISFSSGESVTVAATAVACSSLLGRAFDAPELWFTSTMQAGRTAVIRIVVAGTLFAVKVGAVLLGAPLFVFLGLFAVEPLIGSVLIVLAYRRAAGSPGWSRPDRTRIRELLKSSFPLIVSGCANQLNLRSDIVLIQIVLGSSAVAVYAAGARVSELAYFLPVAFMTASLPVMVSLRAEHGPQGRPYREFLRLAYARAFWLGVVVAVVVAAVGPIVVRILFGAEYAEAATVIRLHVIACPFVFMAAVYSKWIIAENQLWQSVLRHSCGAVVNIALNLILLPRYGVAAAAAATAVSYIVASYLSCFVTRKGREAGIDMTRAMLFPVLWLRARSRSRRSTTAPPIDPQKEN